MDWGRGYWSSLQKDLGLAQEQVNATEIDVVIATPITSVVPEGSSLNSHPLLDSPGTAAIYKAVVYKAPCVPSTREVCWEGRG